jgi:hypothetical protein
LIAYKRREDSTRIDLARTEFSISSSQSCYLNSITAIPCHLALRLSSGAKGILAHAETLNNVFKEEKIAFSPENFGSSERHLLGLVQEEVLYGTHGLRASYLFTFRVDLSE